MRRSSTSLHGRLSVRAAPVIGSERSIRLRGPVTLMRRGDGGDLVAGDIEDANPSIMAHTAGTLSPPTWMTKSTFAAVDSRSESEERVPITGVKLG